MKKLYQLTHLPSVSPANASVPLMRGYIDYIKPVREGRIAVNGWALVPETSMDAYEVWYKGVEVFRHTPEKRPDVATFVPWIPHGELTGLSFELDIDEIGPAGAEMLEIVAFQRDRPIGLLTYSFGLMLIYFRHRPKITCTGLVIRAIFISSRSAR